ncbi:bifunctional metallophosphatase/5'-nucleotidase [Bacillus sp. JJ1764]|uniref:bifunctional metallophosphatase/5'-nucleotidase n=1 Tax=Bacillus sp. JJ1764 TaxID=3122964 RepID=UPI0030001044
METIHIYHTNDVHSHFENWPRIQELLKMETIHHNEDVFLFDIGDFIDRWHPFTEATKGTGNIQLLNECQYTAVTIGNNEGVNLPNEDLEHLYDEAKFEVIVANFFRKNGDLPSWVKPYKIYQTKKGTKIGVIGLTAKFAVLYEQLGWKVTDPIPELKKWMPVLKKEADVIILLSHLGIHDDEQIAEEITGIDVILGAHTHHFLKEGKLIGETLLGAAGKFGYYVGQVTLHVDEDKMIKSKKACLYDVLELPAVEKEEDIIESYFNSGRQLLNSPIAHLDTPLKANPFQKTNFSVFLGQALREWCKTDCSIVNGGLLLGTLSGEVTEFDLLNVCPHPINPCVIKVSGAELLSILQETKDEQLTHRELKGLGFRGTVIGSFVYDGIELSEDGWVVNQNSLDPHQTYSLALPDMFTFGHFFKEVVPKKQKKYFLPEFLRDILKWKLKTQ